MEVIVPLLFLAALAGIFFAAKRGAEAAQREREQRWSQLPGLAPAFGPVPERGIPGGDATAAANGSAPASSSSSGVPAPTASSRPQAAVSAPGRAATATRAPQATRQAAPAATPAASASAAPARRRPAAPAPIDLNMAPVAELQKLPGVGVRAAERIVAHRERHGPFPSVRALEAVEGFDEHRVSRLAPRAKV